MQAYDYRSLGTLATIRNYQHDTDKDRFLTQIRAIVMIIEDIQGEKLKRYRPVFYDLRTGKTDKAGYTVSLFPSEIDAKERTMSRQYVKVTFEVA
jgi:hypothetical protein